MKSGLSTPSAGTVLERGADSGAPVSCARWVWWGTENCRLAENIVKVFSSPAPPLWRVRAEAGLPEPSTRGVQSWALRMAAQRCVCRVPGSIRVPWTQFISGSSRKGISVKRQQPGLRGGLGMASGH